jgi:hypothetical protein
MYPFAEYDPNDKQNQADQHGTHQAEDRAEPEVVIPEDGVV